MELTEIDHDRQKATALETDDTKKIQNAQTDFAYSEAPLKRSLAQRHLVSLTPSFPKLLTHINFHQLQMMMAIGGVIGPGYFVGMGTGLSTAGPAGLLLCFAIVGILLWTVMQCLGELGAFISVSGKFSFEFSVGNGTNVTYGRLFRSPYSSIYRSCGWLCPRLELLVIMGWNYYGRVQYVIP